MLSVPYEERAVARTQGARYFPECGWVHVGKTLPRALEAYRPAPYSWEEWVSQELSGEPSGTNRAPEGVAEPLTLRDDQEADVAAILRAKSEGAPEFILGNDVGTGKTAVAVAAAKAIPGVQRVLVVCPLGVVPGWRSHLRRMGDGGKRWAVINYESAKKLLAAPSSAREAKRTRTKNLRIAREGKPKVQWDVVITDESHARGNPESQRTMMLDRVIAGPGRQPAFVLNLSATAGSNPAQLSYLHRGIAWRTGRRPARTITADEYVSWCAGNGIKVSRGGYGNRLTWERNGADLRKMNMLLFKGEPRWGVRRTPPWDEPRRIPLPVELTHAERVAYEQEWEQFRAAMAHLEKVRRQADSMNGKAPGTALSEANTKGRAAQVRYRQKAGQIKARGTALFVKELLTKGLQVAISCEYIGTVEAVRDALGSLGVSAGEFTGQNRQDREEQRIAFQRGEVPVIIFTPAEGFNLHANDGGIEGASSTPRAIVVAEPRWSPKKALQVEGRCHRDHQLAPVYYSYAEDTVDEKVISTSLAGMRDTKVLMGDSVAHFATLSEALGVPLVLRD